MHMSYGSNVLSQWHARMGGGGGSAPPPLSDVCAI